MSSWPVLIYFKRSRTCKNKYEFLPSIVLHHRDPFLFREAKVLSCVRAQEDWKHFYHSLFQEKKIKEKGGRRGGCATEHCIHWGDGGCFLQGWTWGRTGLPFRHSKGPSDSTVHFTHWPTRFPQEKNVIRVQRPKPRLPPPPSNSRGARSLKTPSCL